MTAPRGYIRPRDGKLEAVIKVPGRPKVRRATGLDIGQEQEAEAVLAEALRQLQAGTLTPSGELTVRAWGERWIEDRKERGKLEWVHEESHLKYFLYPQLGARHLAAVTDVELLDWVRGLEKTRGPSGKTPSPKYVRKISATVRALFKEAVRRHAIEKTPCIWDDSDLPELEANARIIRDGFDAGEVARLVYDERIPEDRRVRYALEFLTGLRPGEVAARTWADWEPVYREGLGRFIVRTAYNTRHRVVKETKTRVEKWIPVHPALAAILEAWRAGGWERLFGRAPKPEDFIVPARRGGLLNNSHSWRCFRDDLRTLGLEHQRHYETRSTFINLAEGAGADPHYVAKLTHPSVRDAKDLYARARQYWPRLCEAVLKIRIDPPVVTSTPREPGSSPASGPGEQEEALESGAEAVRNGVHGDAFDSPALPFGIPLRRNVFTTARRRCHGGCHGDARTHRVRGPC